jgi:hypothetical protein
MTESESNNLEDRIVRVAEAFFQRSGCTKFPEARYVAKRVGCKLTDIEDASDGGRFCLDGVNVEGWKLGDLEVYVMNP